MGEVRLTAAEEKSLALPKVSKELAVPGRSRCLCPCYGGQAGIDAPSSAAKGAPLVHPGGWGTEGHLQ